MKIWTVLKESVQVYCRNFVDLMGAYLIGALLRLICFVPLLFLVEKECAFLAWLCVPMYLLIALPARQNYALALQDMLYGGRVLTPRLISFDRYFVKLWRGLKGMLKMLLWMTLPIAAVLMMVEIYVGKGEFAISIMRLWGVNSRDGLSAMRWFGLFGSDTIDGAKNVLLVVLSLCMLPVIGCAVHCGARHAHALEEKALLRGRRVKLILLWVLGFLFFLPFAVLTLATLGSNLKLFLSGFVQMFMTNSLAIPELGEKLYLIAAAFLLLFLPVVPLKQLIPAVALHQQMNAAYKPLKIDLTPAKETATDAAS